MLSRILFHPGAESGRADLMLLLLRLVCGGYLMLNGYNKWMSAGGPSGWMGPTSMYPSWLLFLACFSELAGGAALIVGLLSRVAAFGVAATCFVAAFMQHMTVAGDPFYRSRTPLPVELPTQLVSVGTQGSTYAFALTLGVIALTVLVVGPGRISLDALLFRLGGGHRRRASFIPA